VSAIAEWEGVKPLFPDAKIHQSPFGDSMNLTLDTWNLTLYHSGWGKISSAAMMQYVIDHDAPDLIDRQSGHMRRLRRSCPSRRCYPGG
jgi:hypothetical protein